VLNGVTFERFTQFIMFQLKY